MSLSPPIPQQALALWKSQGFSDIRVTRWVSNIEECNFEYLKEMVQIFNQLFYSTFSEFDEEREHIDHSTSCLYKYDFVFAYKKVHSPIFGRYLSIYIPYNKSSEQESYTLENQIIAHLHIRFSREMALEKVSKANYSMAGLDLEYSESATLDGGHMGTHRNRSWLYKNAQITFDDEIVPIKFSSRVADLLLAASKTSDNGLRFLYLWIALEVVVGNGIDRRNFFEKNIKSPAISRYVKDLHSTRSALLKSPTFNKNNIGEHSSLLFALVRMATISNPPAQQRCARHIENAIRTIHSGGQLDIGTTYYDVKVTSQAPEKLVCAVEKARKAPK